MAISNPTNRPGIGRQYEKITDTSYDWAFLDNDTIFFDKRSDLLYYKTEDGDVLEYQKAVLTLINSQKFIDKITDLESRIILLEDKVEKVEGDIEGLDERVTKIESDYATKCLTISNAIIYG